MPSRDSGLASRLSLPFDASEANRLSWDLGDLVASRAPAVHTLRADDAVTARLHDVAGRAVVVVVRSPAGREHHYELPRADVRDVLERALANGFQSVDDGRSTAS